MEADRPIREIIRNQSTLLRPKGEQKGLRYCWVFNGNNGLDIAEAETRRWFVVKGDMPEAENHKKEDGTRRIGDVTLMAIKEEDYKLIKEHKKWMDDRVSGRHEDEEWIQKIQALQSKGVKPFDFKDLDQLRKFLGR